MTVLVFGSINMDLVARTPRLPARGETLIGHSFETVPGGKGANQAVAVARLGVPVEMLGRVGQDSFGESLLQGLRANGVGCDRIYQDDTSSGIAIIAVEDSGENHIIVVSGANGRVGKTELGHLKEHVADARVLLLQLEVPLNVVVEAAAIAHQAGITVILDPAPAPQSLPDALYPHVDIITPNQGEAERLVGFPVKDWDSATQAAQVFLQRGVGTALIKLGPLGALCVNAQEQFQVPPFPVEAVDTVAAGDAFNGGLAAALAEGRSLQEATRQAAAVAALSVTKAGAQPSLPNRAELNSFLGMP